MKESSRNLPRPGKVLVVDDDQTFRSEFKEYFDEYGIVEASSGDEALNILKRPNEIDLALLDVRMYGMDGIELLRKIKEMAPDMRIVILTGYSSKDVAVEALRAQADDYLEKPLDLESTKEVMEKLLEKAERNGQTAYDIASKINRVKSFVQRNCIKKLNLTDAAEVVCLSPKYLSRVFKEHTGEAFSSFRLGLKMERAKALLKDSEYNIDEIADRMGYENTESFIRMFEKMTDHTPTEYRKKVRNGNKSSRKKSTRK